MDSNYFGMIQCVSGYEGPMLLCPLPSEPIIENMLYDEFVYEGIISLLFSAMDDDRRRKRSIDRNQIHGILVSVATVPMFL